jgi:hypothetical protein
MTKFRKRHLRKAQKIIEFITPKIWTSQPKTIATKQKKMEPKKPMRILLQQHVFASLEAARVAAGNQEFSGFGFVDVHNSHEETVFEVYDIVVLDVGSIAFTEIPSGKILDLLDRPDAAKMKLWFHRHGIGGSIPGPHNWSSIDDHTAEKEPLGGIPELVRWSISIVRTPQTWVGRFDKYKDGEVTTYHIPVAYGVDRGLIDNVVALRKAFEAKERNNCKGEIPNMPMTHLNTIAEC